MVRVWAHGLKGRGFNSGQGHVPGSQVAKAAATRSRNVWVIKTGFRSTGNRKCVSRVTDQDQEQTIQSKINRKEPMRKD